MRHTSPNGKRSAAIAGAILIGLMLATAPFPLPGESAPTAQTGFGVAPLNTIGSEIAAQGEVLIQVQPGTTQQGASVQRALVGAGISGGAVKPLLDPDFYLISVSKGQERIASANLSDQPGIISATPNYARYIFSIPNDSDYPVQWNFPTIGAPAAWDLPQTSDVIVAILDTGLDMSHPEFRDRYVQGYDFVNDDDDPSDDQGHGTHVAGIVAAASDNGQGVTGMAWRARIMPIKVADKDGRIYSDAWINGLAYARLHGAKVANMSFGGPNISSAEQNAVTKAWNGGLLVVAAAGNCGSGSAGCAGTNPVLWPAAYDNVISVGAVGDDLRRAYYSEYNSNVDLVAPGGDAKYASDSPNHWILSTWPTLLNSNYTRGYNLHIGTSMASPHVAGLAALLLSNNPALTNSAIETRLKNSARDLGTKGRDDDFGYGLIDAAAAVRLGNSGGTTAAPATATPQPSQATLPPPTATRTSMPTATATATAQPAPPTATPTTGPAQPIGFGCVFADVCQSDTAYPYVANLVRDGIMSGYSDNTFRPADPLTRGELARMLVLATGRGPFDAPVAHFSDVPRGSTYYSYVESVYAADIISGYRDGTFRPAEAVNNGQLIKMVILARNWALRAPISATFADVTPGSAYFAYAETGYARGIIAPDAAGNFSPFAVASRGGAASVVDRARR